MGQQLLAEQVVVVVAKAQEGFYLLVPAQAYHLTVLLLMGCKV